MGFPWIIHFCHHYSHYIIFDYHDNLHIGMSEHYICLARLGDEVWLAGNYP
jgi:hypothetical protein